MIIFFYKLLSLAVVHCFLQNEPPFQGLTCWCFDCFMKEHADIICNQLNLKDIPLNSGRHILNLFVQKLEIALLNEELESIFDCEEAPAFEQIWNLRQWKIHEVVTMKNRHFLIFTLDFKELVGKRKKQIKALREGLKILQFYDQIKKHAKFFKIYFVYPKHQLCGNDLINFTELYELKGKGYDIVSLWLAQFLSELTEKEAQNLKLCTSYNNIPLTEDINIRVDFLNPHSCFFAKSGRMYQELSTASSTRKLHKLIQEVMKVLELQCEGFAD